MDVAKKRKYVEAFSYPLRKEVTKYEIVAKIGEGSYGEVFKARDKKAENRFVALKKVLGVDEKEALPIDALREIKILQQVKHDNVVNLIEICRMRDTEYNAYLSTYLVLEFCDYDLACLLYDVNVKFTLGEIKNVMKQLLNGLYYIHSNKILHRDLKPANILITKGRILKLADFGLARQFSVNMNGKVNRYTNCVVTLWYRPPELLLGERNYGPEVDMWSVGCIMAEMWTRVPIMRGDTEQEQLKLICHLCGTINAEVWPGVTSLKLYNAIELPQEQKRKTRQHLMPYVRDPCACELLDLLLVLDPGKRYSSHAALVHDFFWTNPMPCDLSKMLASIVTRATDG
jgi:cyclin-dependent kinase 9